MESIAVVTGGAGGIGLAIAVKLTESHAAVFVVDINPNRLLDSDSEPHRTLLENGKLGVHRCDISNADSVREMAKSIQSLGKVRTLVNNAGVADVHSLQDMTAESWRREISLNLDAHFTCFNAFETALKDNQGVVINVASVNALSVYGDPAYSAAKAGLIHFTKSIAVEYSQYGMRANAVAPGTVRTNVWETRVRENPGVFEEAMQFYPLRRVIEPEDVANAVDFLVHAPAITGVCLPVDCGLTAGQPSLARTFSQSDAY